MRAFALSRIGLTSLFAIAVISFSVAFIATDDANVEYEVSNSSITISGTGSQDWSLTSTSFPFNGRFDQDSEELNKVSDLQFEMPVSTLNSDNIESQELIRRVLNQSNCDKITFKQRHAMVLPLMKMVHVIGDLTLANGSQTVPLQMNFSLNGKDGLTLEGKYKFRLSDFGVRISAEDAGVINDEVEIDLVFQLEKKINL